MAAAGQKMLKPETSAKFDELLSDFGQCILVVHFSAEWSPQCKQMNEVLQELMKNVPSVNVKFVTVEAESLPEVTMKYEVAAVPTFVFLRGGAVVGRVDGAHAPELTQKVNALAQTVTGVATQQPPSELASQEDLDGRLKRLINQAPVMVFMKGSPQEPRCKFSRQVVDIFKEQNVKYGSFNILEDNTVREGLKKYSNWPTYPQLYINGDLLGGLDIIKQMIEEGEFQSALPKSGSLEDRLKGLINKAPVVLFMKGSPGEPRCGFSRTVTSILGETGVEYETFDILEDEEVRQGLKKYSNWPTYPQLYVKGELIGGLDIIRELQESGELASSLGL